ncbi:MAG: glycoside hydrolase family 15 [Prevotellaceae bacterium]|nr:glycoside hydrolase family 15 [Prevotellaceae bacterium]
MATESLYEIWAKRNPEWEIRYENNIIKTFCDYNRGATSMREDRAKILGAGYEIFIVAFFIGLYYNQKKPLTTENRKRKSFGWAIQNWGNIESRGGRKPYPKLREYIFAALVARTDVDFIALDKGEITARKAVDMLMQTMEEYANFGFHFMEDKLIDNPGYFYASNAFLEVFLSFDASVSKSEDDEEPEALD